MTGRLVAAAVTVVLTLSACSAGASGDSETGEAAATRPSPTAQVSLRPAPCPALEHAAPVKDGLPDLELPCLGDGPAVNLADLRGLPTVVNVWAAWCTNCEREMPLFAEAQSKADDRVRFFGVHYKASRDYGLQSEADFGVPFPSVHEEDGDRVVREMGAYAPPQTFFVAADGTVAGREIGEITSADELSALIEDFLGVTL